MTDVCCPIIVYNAEFYKDEVIILYVIINSNDRLNYHSIYNTYIYKTCVIHILLLSINYPSLFLQVVVGFHYLSTIMLSSYR